MSKGLLCHRVSSDSGVVLIAVLWTAILLSVLATELIVMSRSDARLLVSEQERLQVSEAAEAAVNLTLLALSDPKGGIPLDGVPQKLRFENIDVAVSVSAEAGKVDLNTGDRELIRGLLTVEGVGPGNAEKIADAILERRMRFQPSGDGPQSVGMIETGGNAFQTKEDLFQVPRMDRQLFERLAPNVTLYSGSPSVDAALAPTDVLLAIPGNTRADAEAAQRDRSIAANDTHRAADLSRVIGQAFTISAVAQSADGVTVRKSKVVRVVGNPKQPIWTLADN